MQYSLEMHDDLFEKDNRTLANLFNKTQRGLIIIDFQVHKYFLQQICLGYLLFRKK